MMYGGISAYIMFHGEISEQSAYIALPSSISELALLRAPELAEQSGLALESIWKALGSLWKALGSVLEASKKLLEAS